MWSDDPLNFGIYKSEYCCVKLVFIFPDIQVQNALCGLDVWDKRTEGRWFWTDEQQSKTPHPSCNRYNRSKVKV